LLWPDPGKLLPGQVARAKLLVVCGCLRSSAADSILLSVWVRVGLWLKMLFVCARLRLIPPLAFKIKNQDVTPIMSFE
jgi:hypothetical protein